MKRSKKKESVSSEIKKAKGEATKEPSILRIPVCNKITPDFIAEQVWDENHRPAFQVHYFDAKKTDRNVLLYWIDLGELSGEGEKAEKIVYVPIDNDNLRKGSVIIPDACLNVESATFEELWNLQEQLLEMGFDPGDQQDEARLHMAICTSSWFLDRENLGIAGMGRFAPFLPTRGLSGGGKNRWLNLLRFCSYHTFYQIRTDKIPSLYRPCEMWKGVLALDEADFDSTKDRDIVTYLLSRSYGIPISRQNPNSPSVSDTFDNFQLTIIAQRKAFGENALEGRSIPFYAKKTFRKLPTIETPKMVELGRKIQSLSLALRLKYWDKTNIDREYWFKTNDARLNSSLLPLEAISHFEPRILELINSLIDKIERRKTSLKASSADGLIVNFLYEKIIEDLFRPFKGNEQKDVFYFLDSIEEVKDDKGNVKFTIEVVLTTTKMRDALSWISATDIRHRLDGFLHIDGLPDAPRIGGRKTRPIFFKAGPLVDLFREFVVDFDIKNLPEWLFGQLPADGDLDSLRLQTTERDSQTRNSAESPEPAARAEKSVPSAPSVPPASGTDGTLGTLQKQVSKAENRVEEKSTLVGVATTSRIIYPKCAGCDKEVGHGSETVKIRDKKKYCPECFEQLNGNDKV